MTREELIATLDALGDLGPESQKLATGMLLGWLRNEGYIDVVLAYLRAAERLGWTPWAQEEA